MKDLVGTFLSDMQLKLKAFSVSPNTCPLKALLWGQGYFAVQDISSEILT